MQVHIRVSDGDVCKVYAALKAIGGQHVTTCVLNMDVLAWVTIDDPDSLVATGLDYVVDEIADELDFTDGQIVISD
jgi:hypothetical protein